MIIFIPIKNESQRVPNKNFRIFNQKALYQHTLSKFSQHRVFVDTDSDRVLQEVENMEHVTAFRRDNSLCGHEVSVCDLIKSFIARYKIEEPICQIHVTNPFLKERTLVDAYSFMDNHDSVVSCNRYNSRFWRKENYGFCPVNHNPLKLQQTQDLPDLFEENSCFYIFNPSVIKNSGNRIGLNPFFYEIEYPQNLDIDTESDWNIALRELDNGN